MLVLQAGLLQNLASNLEGLNVRIQEHALSNSARLHRRAVIGSALLLAILVQPFLAVLAWLNWSIVFRGTHWAEYPTEFGAPEFVVLMIGTVGGIIFFRTVARWLLSVGEARFNVR